MKPKNRLEVPALSTEGRSLNSLRTERDFSDDQLDTTDAFAPPQSIRSPEQVASEALDCGFEEFKAKVKAVMNQPRS